MFHLSRRSVVAVLLLLSIGLYLLPTELLATWRLAVFSAYVSGLRTLRPPEKEIPPSLESSREDRDPAARLETRERELRELRDLLAQSRAELADARRRLGQLAEAREYLPTLRFTTAFVIGRPMGLSLGDEEENRSGIILDRGADDGLAPGDAVLQGQAVLGQVTEAHPHAARVLLLNSPRSVVAGHIGKNRTECYVRGTLTGGCEAVFFGRRPDVGRGDLVFTSGFLGVFPPDLIIGALTAPPVEGPEPVTFVAPLEIRAETGALDLALVVRRLENPALQPTGEGR
ncbi:MAG: rod shape-determining protein MreC [Planctomycetota bacterium]